MKVDEVVIADMPRMPERDIGLPPLPHQNDHQQNFAQDAGPGFAGDQQQAFSHNGNAPGGARFDSSAESGGSRVDVQGLGEQTVALASPRTSPLTIGADGRIQVDALI